MKNEEIKILNNPLVSIVFTSYNHIDYLQIAINSLISQTYENFELIIVDDCSTDGSKDLLEKICFDNRIQLYLLEKNTGSYVNATNFGASKAKGDYLVFAQCDDFANEIQLEELVKHVLLIDTVGVVFSSSNLVDANGNFISNDYFHRELKFKKRYNSNSFIKGDLMFDFFTKSCVIPNLSAALIRKDLYLRVNKLNSLYRVTADWEFWMKLALITDFFYIRKPLNNFRQHTNTIRNSFKNEVQVSEIFSFFSLFLNNNKITNKKLKFGACVIALNYFKSNPNYNYLKFTFKECYKFSDKKITILLLAILFLTKEYFYKILYNLKQR